MANLQQGLPAIGWYGPRLRSLSMPADEDAPSVYPLYDRWSDVFNTMTEAVSVNIGRGLAATAWLMARTPLATQRWQAAGSTIELESGAAGVTSRAVRLVSPGLDLGTAVVTWESDADPPRRAGLRVEISSRAPWVEGEALLADRRRVFAVREVGRR